MRKLLVFQHSAREPLGVFDPMLRRAGFPLIYAQPIARMRGERPRRNPLKLAKRSALGYLARFAGNMNTLVRARRPLEEPSCPAKSPSSS